MGKIFCPRSAPLCSTHITSSPQPPCSSRSESWRELLTGAARGSCRTVALLAFRKNSDQRRDCSCQGSRMGVRRRASACLWRADRSFSRGILVHTEEEAPFAGRAQTRSDRPRLGAIGHSFIGRDGCTTPGSSVGGPSDPPRKRRERWTELFGLMPYSLSGEPSRRTLAPNVSHRLSGATPRLE